MTDSKEIRGLIREHFGYLLKDYDFVDDQDIDTDEIYSEVRYKKNEWKVSIVTTAHGTKISMSLISPQDGFGFLSHYFNTMDKEYNRTENGTKSLRANVEYNSEFLRTKGRDILTADSEQLTKILELTQVEQDKWIKQLMKKHSDT